MKEIADLIMNYGIGVLFVLVYFMYFNSTTMKSLINTMNEMKQSLVLLNERIENIENAVKKKSGVETMGKTRKLKYLGFYTGARW